MSESTTKEWSFDRTEWHVVGQGVRVVYEYPLEIAGWAIDEMTSDHNPDVLILGASRLPSQL